MSQPAEDHRRFLRKNNPPRMLPRGSFLPRLTVQSSAGKPIVIADWMAPRGGLLVMLSMDCPLCPSAFEVLVKYLKEHPNLEARILIDATAEEAESLLHQYDICIPVALCSTKMMFEDLSTQGVPWVYAVNAVGQVLGGGPFNDEEQLDFFGQMLLAEV